jgi:Na+-driven multidrug efflux pump
VTGAAIATGIGRGTGVLYQLWHLTVRTGRIRLRLRHLRPKAKSSCQPADWPLTE